MLKPEEQPARLLHLIDSVEGRLGRIECALNAEQLEEIGYLTILMGTLEESIAIFCEVLLTRPELAGFLSSKKAVTAKQLKEKLELFMMLIRASGTLYSIETDTLEKRIAAVAEIGEDRNAIIHGLLARDITGTVTFHIRNRKITAGVTGLRTLTKRCQSATIDVVSGFQAFYKELAARKSIDSRIEGAMQAAFISELAHHKSSHVVREDTLELRAHEAKTLESFQSLGKSRSHVADAKRTARNTKTREGMS